MDFIKLSEFLDVAREKPSARLVIAAAEDKHVLEAVRQAVSENIIHPVLVGNLKLIRRIADEIVLDISSFPLFEESDPEKACRLAVKMIREDEADVLMKGSVPSAPLLKAVLDNEHGLRDSDLLSHLAIFEIPGYHKLLGISDAAMNIQPDMDAKISIIRNAVDVYTRLGKKMPKIALLAPIERVNPKIKSTLDAYEIKKLFRQNILRSCIIDGPLALDNAISAEAAKSKGIDGPVAGDADILIVPDLNSGNILYKSLIFFANSISAAIITGAKVPIVLTSRADSDRSKLMSIALAAIM